MLAVVGVIVAVVAVIALQNPKGREASKVTADVHRTSASRPPTKTPRPSAHPTSRPSSRPTATRPVPLVVLNNTSTSGLADFAAALFRGGGWQVTATADYANDILSTCAYYDPSNPANQQAALQLQQQFPRIVRVKEKFDGLPAGPLVVVLTSDWS
ncbi:MAG: LytR C-terminal domain-containing protein [Actinomycetota bacterium]